MLEKEVSAEIKKKLNNLKRAGLILYFLRVNSGTVQNSFTGSWLKLAEDGHPDYIVVFESKYGWLVVLFIEVKRSGIYETRKGKQTEWREAHENKHKDMIYLVAQSVKDMTDVIFKVGKDRVGEINF